jgi:polysaccharide pyruvyl transferase WcaK-like protein
MKWPVSERDAFVTKLLKRTRGANERRPTHDQAWQISAKSQAREHERADGEGSVLSRKFLGEVREVFSFGPRSDEG